MKVRVSPIRTLGILAIVIFGGAALIFGMTFQLFLFSFPYDWRQYAIIGVWSLTSIGLIVASFTLSYYEVYKKYVTIKKGAKEIVYYYSDVVYIDEEQSVKKKTVCFYTRQGHARYLPFDKKGILYKTMVDNCKNRLSKEEFAIKYPKVKL